MSLKFFIPLATTPPSESTSRVVDRMVSRKRVRCVSRTADESVGVSASWSRKDFE